MDLPRGLVVIIGGLVLVGGPGLVSGNELLDCPEGKFQPSLGAPCVECSRCPDNQIVRETCWQQRDTVCGMFTEFQPFHTDNKVSLYQTYDVERNVKSVTHEETSDNGGSSWQTASIVMIALLGITSVLCVVLVSAVCYKCRKDKKDGLMIFTGKAEPHDVSSAGPSNIHRLPSTSSTGAPVPQSDVTMCTCPERLQQFELSDEKSTS